MSSGTRLTACSSRREIGSGRCPTGGRVPWLDLDA
jgi:hypothetical protein